MSRRVSCLSFLGLLLVSWLLVLLDDAGLFAPVDRVSGDIVLRLRGDEPVPEGVVVVEIDRETIDGWGGSIPLDRLSDLLEALNARDAASITVVPPLPQPTGADEAARLRFRNTCSKIPRLYFPWRGLGEPDAPILIEPWLDFDSDNLGSYVEGVSMIVPDEDGFVRTRARDVVIPLAAGDDEGERDDAGTGADVAEDEDGDANAGIVDRRRSLAFVVAAQPDVPETIRINYTGGAHAIKTISARAVIEGQNEVSDGGNDGVRSSLGDLFLRRHVLIGVNDLRLGDRGYPVALGHPGEAVAAAEIEAQTIASLQNGTALGPVSPILHGAALVVLAVVMMIALTLFGLRSVVPVAAVAFGGVVVALVLLLEVHQTASFVPAAYTILAISGWTAWIQFGLRPTRLARLLELSKQRETSWFSPPDVQRSPARFAGSLAEYLRSLFPNVARVDFWETRLDSARLHPLWHDGDEHQLSPPRGDQLSLSHPIFREALIRPGRFTIMTGLMRHPQDEPTATLLMVAHTEFQILGFVGITVPGTAIEFDARPELLAVAEPLGRQLGLVMLRRRLQATVEDPDASRVRSLARRATSDPVTALMVELELYLLMLLREHRVLLQVVDGMPIAIGIYDLFGRREGLNTQARQLLTALNSRAPSMDLPEMLQLLQPDVTLSDQLQRLQNLVTKGGRIEIILEAGARHYELTIQPILSDTMETRRVLGLSLSAIDTTVHEHLHAYKAHVAELVSYRMKTAVMELLGAAEVIASISEELPEEIGKSVRDFVDMIERKAAELEAVLEEFLKIAGETTSLQIRTRAAVPLDFSAVIETVMSELHRQLPEAQVTVRAPQRLNPARGERATCEEIIWQIFGYILEMVPPRSEIVLRLTEKPESILLEFIADLYLAQATVRALEAGVEAPETQTGVFNLRELARMAAEMYGDLRFIPSEGDEVWRIALLVPKF